MTSISPFEALCNSALAWQNETDQMKKNLEFIVDIPRPSTSRPLSPSITLWDYVTGRYLTRSPNFSEFKQSLLNFLENTVKQVNLTKLKEQVQIYAIERGQKLSDMTLNKIDAWGKEYFSRFSQTELTVIPIDSETISGSDY